VFNGASGLWFIKQSSTGTVATVGFGGSGYVTVPGAYDGDFKTDRPSITRHRGCGS